MQHSKFLNDCTFQQCLLNVWGGMTMLNMGQWDNNNIITTCADNCKVSTKSAP